MSAYDVKVDGYRYTRLQEAGFILLGFFLGIPGILIDWAIARKKKMMECSAEGIWLGIIGAGCISPPYSPRGDFTL